MRWVQLGCPCSPECDHLLRGIIKEAVRKSDGTNSLQFVDLIDQCLQTKVPRVCLQFDEKAATSIILSDEVLKASGCLLRKSARDLQTELLFKGSLSRSKMRSIRPGGSIRSTRHRDKMAFLQLILSEFDWADFFGQPCLQSFLILTCGFTKTEC